MGLQHYTQDKSKIPLKNNINVLFYIKYTHPTLICRGTDARTHGRTDGRKIFTQYSGITSSCSLGSTDFSWQWGLLLLDSRYAQMEQMLQGQQDTWWQAFLDSCIGQLMFSTKTKDSCRPLIQRFSFSSWIRFQGVADKVHSRIASLQYHHPDHHQWFVRR